MSQTNNDNIRVQLGLLLASVFAAWGSYLIHVIPIEQPALPVLEALIDLSGRAPDQYRVIPYLLIGAIRDVINVFPGVEVELRYPVLIFDSLFLFLSTTALRKHFDEAWGRGIAWYLLLVYPFLMFDGYRPTSSFILFMSIHAVVLMQKAHAGDRKGWQAFAVLILVMSFTRADIAFLFAVSALGLANAGFVMKAGILVVPLAVQLLLAKVLFPNAEYFSAVVMISDNLSLEFLVGSPFTYLLLALAVLHWNVATRFVYQAAINHRFVLLAMVGYTLTLFVIARPNEYRLFLPFLPLILWLHKEYSSKSTESGDMS